MSILDIFKKKKKEEPKRIIDAVAVGLDPMFEDAARLVAQMSYYSKSYLQRKLKIGYNQAERIEEELEYAGIIGPIIESMVPREILIVTEGPRHITLDDGIRKNIERELGLRKTP